MKPGKGKGALPFLAAVLAVVVWISGCGLFVKHKGDVVPVREAAPGFSLQNQNGEAVTLQELLDRGPVLVVFYRGHW
jgi:hypothetical protein